MNFVKLTDKDTGENVYVRSEDIVIVVPLTEDILHQGDFDYDRKKDSYNKDIIFSGIQTKYGIIHVRETTDEIMELI